MASRGDFIVHLSWLNNWKLVAPTSEEEENRITDSIPLLTARLNDRQEYDDEQAAQI